MPAALLTVLSLGDSMGLCGFAAHFDKRLREDPPGQGRLHVRRLCDDPVEPGSSGSLFSTPKRFAAFLTIKTKEGDDKPEKYEDTYGMTKGHKPVVHTIPKLEDLLAEHTPDVLVLQTGDNLLRHLPRQERGPNPRSTPTNSPNSTRSSSPSWTRSKAQSSFAARVLGVAADLRPA